MNLSSSGLKAIVPSPISSPPQMWDSAKDTCDMADTSGNVALPGSLDDAAQEQEQDARRAEQPDGGKQGEQVVADATPSASNSGDHVEMLLAALSEMQATHEAKIADMLTNHMDQMLRSCCGVVNPDVQSESREGLANKKKSVDRGKSDETSIGMFSPTVSLFSQRKNTDLNFGPWNTVRSCRRSDRNTRGFSVRMLSNRGTSGNNRMMRIARASNDIASDMGHQDTSRPSFHLDQSIEALRMKLQDKYAFQRWANTIVDNPRFELGVAFLIFLNALILGIEADLAVQDVSPEPAPWSIVVEAFFAIAFSFELVLHALDQGKSYFHPYNKMVGWNFFDTCVVALSWVDLVLAVTEASFSSLRMLRIIKMTRLLRIVRVMRYCRELREMVHGILASLKPLFWCLILLLLVWFSLGIWILQIEHQFMLDYPALNHSELLKFYGSMMKTIYTLFTTITGGKDWYDAAALLGDMSPVMPVIFSVYIAFAVLCVLNIVTGVFVEHSKAITAADAEHRVLEEVTMREKRSADMKKVFVMATQIFQSDLERNTFSEEDEKRTSLTEEQFVAFCEDTSCQAYFRSIGLLVEGASAVNLFRFIDCDNDGCVTQEEFVTQCNLLQGTARQLDVTLLQYEVKQVLKLSHMLLDQVVATSPQESDIKSDGFTCVRTQAISKFSLHSNKPL